ncbi:unnamed protein product [Effrenium voratum]|uniref:Uncharacterized protein n=1 Tax=Effrenium voratum TaxID=2562239 RepID=A0AA36ND55_9DINO|nr:unnamed protein product [Effrenium voratum]
MATPVRARRASRSEFATPVKAAKPAALQGIPELAKEEKAGSSKEEERVELVIHDTPEGPIFHLDGETYRVLDVPALWEVGIIETKPRASRSLADLKQSLRATEGNEGDCDMT